jgi:hypothetical protein
MKRNLNLCVAAFAAGAIAILWVVAGYFGAHPLALSMTLLIGVVYALGGLELLRFQQATDSLQRALDDTGAPPAELGAWLGRLHPSLQNAVRLRIEGERIGLPGPAVTPYLVGLLVMLGMLGTFLGMVVTLNGAVIALEGTTDLQTMRNTLSAPIKGLGLAFGTSVAGVAASAMLGLVSSLCRRERQQAAQALDHRIATVLRGFSLAHQRQETYKALQAQSAALPEVAGQMQRLMEQMERHQQQLAERLLASQEGFQREVKDVYAELARSVDQSLKASLADGARLAGEGMRPVVEATLSGIAREAGQLHQRMADAATAQLDGLATRFDATAGKATDAWNAALARHEASGERIAGDLRQTMEGFAIGFEQRSAALVERVGAVQTAAQAEFARREQERAAAFAQALADMAAALQSEWRQAGAEAQAQQRTICDTFDRTAREVTVQAQAHARETIAEVTRLMQTAAEAPRAAAEVVGQLRQELSNSMARDNTLLEERSRILGTLNGLLDAINHAAAEQRSAIDGLVASSAALLERAGKDFAERGEAESARLAAAAAQVGGSAVEVASLGESLGAAVQQFGAANETLVAQLQRIEGALDKSLARSDEQLAYYVAQAREIVDLAVLSQQRIVDELQQRAAAPVALAEEVG